MQTTSPARERAQRVRLIRALPAALRAAVAGLDDRQLDTPYREGGWTVRQVAHHLADSHMNAFIRMKLILCEDHPTLKPYNQDHWAELPDGKEPPIAASLAILDGLHERWAAMLDRIADGDWVRWGHHPERGEVSLDDLLRIYATHGEKHVTQITALRASRGW